MGNSKKYNIPICKHVFLPEDFQAVQEPLKTAWVVQGPFVKKFEDQFCDFTKVDFSIATTSCTTAMHVGVAALGLKPGDEVIVPAFTWIASPNVVEYMGAKPVFCDIDLETFNIDVSKIEALITSRTVGIIPVHLFGLCVEMDEIMAIAKRHNLWVLEDAACALGAWYKGRHAGTIGEVGCFSFHPRKSITVGEGGMITTRDPSLATLSRSLRDHGASRTDLDRHSAKAAFLLAEYKVLGYNYRMTDLQAALGTSQMARIESILSKRRFVAERYNEMLRSIDWIIPPKVPIGHVHGYQAYVALFQPEAPTWSNIDKLSGMRNDLLLSLEEFGIATRQGTHSPVFLDYYVNKYAFKPEQFPNAYFSERLSLTLPLYPDMTEDEQDIVIKHLTVPC